MAAVAVEGFSELANTLWRAPEGHGGGRDAIGAVASAYVAFAWEQLAIYEAMFAMPTSLRFAEVESPPAARDAFAALAAVVPGGNVETATETFWAALHGLAELERAGRIRCSASEERLTLAVNGLRSYDQPLKGESVKLARKHADPDSA